MRILITGGAGFLGSHVCELLIARGDSVVCLDDLSSGRYENIEHLTSSGRFTFVQGSVLNPIDLPGTFDGVMHLASPASPPEYLQRPVFTLMTGAEGTRHALDFAREKGARLVLASTSEVYGDPEVHPQPETYWGNVNPVGPRSVYDEAKRYAEAITMAYRESEGVDTGIVRIFNTYGPRMRPHDGRAIPTFLRQALEEKPLTVFGDGSQTRSFCFVDDLVRGLILLAESGEHLPVNIGNPDEYSLLQLAETVIDITETDSEIVFEALPVDDPQVRQPDIRLARERLGWEPEISLRDGLKRTIEESGRDRLIGKTV